MRGLGLDLSDPGWGQVATCCEEGNKYSCPFKCRECLDWKKNC